MSQKYIQFIDTLYKQENFQDLFKDLCRDDEQIEQYEDMNDVPFELFAQNNSVLKYVSSLLTTYLETYNGYKVPKKRSISKPTRTAKTRKTNTRRNQKKNTYTNHNKTNQAENEIFQEILKDFQDQISREDLQKLLYSLREQGITMFQNDPKFKEKFLQSLKTHLNYKQNENIKFINTRQPQNFVTYQQEKDADQFPENCTHVKICYFIWDRQGKNNTDPTAVGRKIKKMHLFVSQKEYIRCGQLKLKKNFF